MIELPVPVVLASNSPQRRKLLRQVLGDFEVLEPRVDERSCGGFDPEEVTHRLAEAKAEEVSRRRPGALVIAADTLVQCQGEIIGKPADRADAMRMLTALSSQPHRVITGLCVLAPDGRRRSVVGIAEIRMRKLSQQQIEAYVDDKEVLGRAGAYGLKELDPNIIDLKGSPTAVMGLPLEELSAILRDLYPEGV